MSSRKRGICESRRNTRDSRRSKSFNLPGRSALSNSTTRGGNGRYSGEREKGVCSVVRQSPKTHSYDESGETSSRKQHSTSKRASEQPGTFSAGSRRKQEQRKRTSKAAENATQEIERKESSDDKRSNNSFGKKTPSKSRPTSKDNNEQERSHPKKKVTKTRPRRSNNATNNSRKRRHSPSTKTYQQNKKSRRKINPFICYNDRLTRLLSKDPSEIIMALLDDHAAFCEFLKGENMSAKSIEEILEILSKLYDTPYTQNFTKIFTIFQSTAFLKHLRRYILRLRYSQCDGLQKKPHLERIIRLFNELLSQFPDMCEDLPLDVLFTYADECSTTNNNDNSSNKTQVENEINNNERTDPITPQGTDISTSEDPEPIKDSIVRLKSLRDEILKRKHSPTSVSVVKNIPPDDYKIIPVFPRREDISPDKPPYLRKNIVHGRYTDVNHYLDVQFRLLREDYIAPIREGVLEVVGTQENQTRSIYVYRNVKIVGRLLDTKLGGLLLRLQFHVSRMHKINWAHSKRFKYGSLFCLIDSNITSTMYFVTIAERDPKELERGFIKVKLFDDNVVEFMNDEEQFFMIESPAYFESYRHVLEGLQNFNKDNLPFQRYLVECKLDVRPPAYLKKSINSYLEETDRESEKISGNTSSHACYDLTEALSCQSAKSVVVEDPKAWPSLSHVDLNESQYNALKAAVTEEFVVIQGPPGTGKTFVGLRIANALLKNKSIWCRRKPLSENEIRNERREIRSPILVVCYTNHALDQFLEGIMQVTDNIVRVGGRGKSESLERFHLKARKKVTTQSVHCRVLKSKLKDIQARIEQQRRVIEAAGKELPPKELENVLSNEEEEQLEQWQRVADQMRVHRIEAWLKMQDEADDVCRNKRKRSSSEIDETKSNNLTPKRGRNTSDSDSTISLKLDGLNPSFMKEMNSLSPAENNEEKIGGLDELEEGEIPDSDDEMFYQNSDTHSTSEVNNVIFERTVVPKTDAENKNIENNKSDLMVIDTHSDIVRDESKDNDSLISSLGIISCNEGIVDNIDNNAVAQKNSNNQVERSGSEDLDELNDVITEDAEEGEIFDSEDDVSDSDNISDDGDKNRGIDLTAIIERKISLIRRRQGNDKERVEEKINVGEDVLPEAQNQYNEQTYQVVLKELSEDQRSHLYQKWVNRYFELHREKIECLRKTHDEKLQQITEIESIQMEGILKNVDVIGMTTTGAAKHRLTLQEIKPRIVIVEEAAEVLEGHVITALSSGTDHLILIGDHKQLKPNPTVYELAKKYKLDVSLFERMVNNGLKCHSLNTQHRMRPEIADIMRIIYPKLIDHSSVKRYKSINGIQHNVYFIDHLQPESGNEELKSHSNQHEVEFVAALCNYLLLQGYQGNSITVLTMYTGQLIKLQCRMPKESYEGIRIYSVDNFQGEESDIIILSLVRSNKNGVIGFLNIPNRVCVALSRAKKAMYCIGNITMMAKKNKLWNQIKNHLHQNSMIGISLPLCCPKHPEKTLEATSAEDFKRAPQGGCMSPCGFRLPCGHACHLHCHPVDPKHEKYRCTEKCLEELCDLKHRCKKRCHFGEKCEPCKEKVSYIVPSCKHEIQIECHERGEITCPIPCTNKLSCGHQCAGKCGEECKSISCRIKVLRTLKCGHAVSMPCSSDVQYCKEPCEKMLDCGHKCPGDCFQCYEGKFHVKCKQACKRLLVCSHECKEPCTKYCPPCEERCKNRCNHSYCPKRCSEPCTPCREPCMWKCEHLKCTKRCGEICNRGKCNQPCRKPLKCGHQCVGVCGDICPQLCRICNKEKLQTIFLGNEDEPDALYVELVDCGHVFEVTDLDYWMEGMQETETAEIQEKKIPVQLKVCPRCKTAIRRSLRYGIIVKKTLADIEKIKKIKLEKQRQLQEKTFQLRQRVCELKKKLPKLDYNFLMMRLDEVHSDADACNTIENQLQFFSCLNEIDEMFFTGPEMADFVKRASQLLKKEERIRSHLRRKTILTNQEIKDIRDNIAFLALSCQFDCMLWKIDKHDKSSVLSEEIKSSIKSAKEIMSRQGNAVDTPLAVTDEERALVASVIENVNRKVGVTALTPKELVEINKAFNFSKAGHWFKCPNGHIYVITECGGAMETSKCWECEEMIGGSNHKLVESNQLAPEIDGATHAAWSDRANLLNYDPQELRRLRR